MDKLKDVINIILQTELEDSEKLALISRLTNVSTDQDFTSVVSEIADFLDASASKLEQQDKVYDKYKEMAVQLDQEIKQINEAPLQNFVPNSTQSAS